eukprot:359104-Rhodomonas_salina.1
MRLRKKRKKKRKKKGRSRSGDGKGLPKLSTLSRWEMFPNIPAAMWWCVNCLSTVGYGDAVPITPAGQLLGALAG